MPVIHSHQLQLRQVRFSTKGQISFAKLTSQLCTDWNPNVGDPNSGGCRFVRGACLCTYTHLDSRTRRALLSHKHCMTRTCTGCNVSQHRQIVFTVDLVLHESAFPTLPSAGETVASMPPMQFCAGDGSVCSSASLQVLIRVVLGVACCLFGLFKN